MTIKVTELISSYELVDNEFKYIDARKKYVVANWDDLQNLLMTLIDFSVGKVKFEVEVEADHEQ